MSDTNRVAQGDHLITLGINHVLANIPLESMRGGNWEVQEIKRYGAQAADIILAVGAYYPSMPGFEWTPDRRPRIGIHIAVLWPD